MRHPFAVADLATLFLKNHFELRERFLRQPSALLIPFDIALNLGSGLPGSTAMRMVSGNGVLELHFREGARSLVVIAPVAQLAGDAAQLEVTLGDGARKTSHKVSAEGLASLEVPAGFAGLKDKVVKHLQSLFPAALGKAKPSDSGASGEEQSGAAAAPASESAGQATAPAPEDEHRWYVVQRHNEPDLKFRGKLLASRQSLVHKGRSYVYAVFETPSGKFVGIKRGLSHWLGERDTIEVSVVDSKEQLPSFFGYSPLAKALYADVGLPCQEVLE